MESTPGQLILLLRISAVCSPKVVFADSGILNRLIIDRDCCQLQKTEDRVHMLQLFAEAAGEGEWDAIGI